MEEPIGSEQGRQPKKVEGSDLVFSSPLLFHKTGSGIGISGFLDIPYYTHMNLVNGLAELDEEFPVALLVEHPTGKSKNWLGFESSRETHSDCSLSHARGTKRVSRASFITYCYLISRD